MTDNKNTNSAGQNSGNGDSNGFSHSAEDRQWEHFINEYEGDFNDEQINSIKKQFEKNAKKIERKRKKEIKKAIKNASFNDDFAAINTKPGPRDVSGISWIDDDPSSFSPENPVLPSPSAAGIAVLILIVAGIAAAVCALIFSAVPSIVGSIGGICILLGFGLFLANHKGFNETRKDEFDDGARI